jgi:hypothetical protein
MKSPEAPPRLASERTEAAPDQDPAVTLHGERMDDSVGARIERVRQRSLPTKLQAGELEESPQGNP